MPTRKAGRGRPLTEAQRRHALELYGGGMSLKRTAGEVGCSERTVSRICAASLTSAADGSVPPADTSPSRSESGSQRGLAAGESPAQIASALGRPRSTVTRELDRNGGPERYRALAAHKRAIDCLTRPKPTKLSCSPRLREAVEAGLAQRWSPLAGLRQTETRAPLRSGDEDQPRDDLPIALRPGPRRATPPTGPQPAHGTHEAKGPGRRPRAPRGQNRRDGADRPATARGRRAQGAGSLGGRFARRQAKPFLRRHPGRAPYPLRDVGSAGLRPDHRERDPSA